MLNGVTRFAAIKLPRPSCSGSSVANRRSGAVCWEDFRGMRVLGSSPTIVHAYHLGGQGRTPVTVFGLVADDRPRRLPWLHCRWLDDAASISNEAVPQSELFSYPPPGVPIWIPLEDHPWARSVGHFIHHRALPSGFPSGIIRGRGRLDIMTRLLYHLCA